MTGIKPGSLCTGSNCSAKCAITTASIPTFVTCEERPVGSLRVLFLTPVTNIINNL